MKNLNRGLLAAGCAVVLSLATSANAHSRAVCNDGIAASPKVRQYLADQDLACTCSDQMAGGVAAYRPVGDDGIAASPKVRQLLDENSVIILVPYYEVEPAPVGYQATTDDGITASPKAREQMQQPTVIEVTVIESPD